MKKLLYENNADLYDTFRRINELKRSQREILETALKIRNVPFQKTTGGLIVDTNDLDKSNLREWFNSLTDGFENELENVITDINNSKLVKYT